MATKETRTEYQWAEGSVIRHLEVRQQRNGQAIAYLYADERPELFEARQNIRAALRLQGFGTVSDYRNGQFGLRVSGLKNGDALISALTKEGLVPAPGSIKTFGVEEAKPKNFLESVRSNSLRAAGMFYSLGNLVYLTSGLLRSHEKKEPDYGQIGSALVWGSGDILIAAIGGRDDSRQFTSLLNKLEHHFTREGIEIPQNAALKVETSTKDKTIGSRIYDVLHENLNRIKCGTEVFAAFFYYRAGKNQGNVWKQRTAVTFGLGFLASLVIPEKKIDPEKYAEAGALGRLWMKIQSNPLSIGGISGYSNTIFTTMGAYSEGEAFKKGELIGPPDKRIPASKYYQLDYAAPAVMLFGNSLYAISKKNTGGDIKGQGTISDVYSIAAQVLNKQPENIRQVAVESTAKFLGSRPEIKDTREQIVKRLTTEMALQKQNPWFEPVHLPSYVPTPKAHALSHAPHPQVQAEGLQHQGNAAELSQTQAIAASK